MARNALLINLTDEDIAYGAARDRWNCAIVRSIQREHPEAVYVTADKKGIAMSIPEAGKDGERYKFAITPEVTEVIRAFDEGREIPEELRTFSVIATEVKPMVHIKRTNRAEAAKKRAQNPVKRRRSTSKSHIVRNTNRFLDAEADE